ncbi:MAG: tellurite resistance TerB family protein, partial [Desulfobulbaceae bacterium]|nr:tellurite resistance TerB family protein [Desulfobulbaceae bacterium]
QGLTDSDHGFETKYHSKKKYGKKKHNSDDIISKMAGSVLSGKGLMTAIGLGVGAYTIMKDKNATPSQPVPHATSQQNYRAASPPPPPPPPPTGSKNITPSPQNQTPQTEKHCDSRSSDSDKNIALRCIQVMIAAAHADGKMDGNEESAILGRFRESGFSKEEKQYILNELHHPKTIPELTASMDDPKVNQMLYSLAVSTIIVDTEQERNWLDQFAEALSISKGMQEFLEE